MKPDRLAAARRALAELSPEELRARRSRAGRASAHARRQIATEAITVTVRIRPAHALSPEQLAAWRSFWRAVLATEPDMPGVGDTDA